jgi:hypothetical protein
MKNINGIGVGLDHLATLTPTTVIDKQSLACLPVTSSQQQRAKQLCQPATRVTVAFILSTYGSASDGYLLGMDNCQPISHRGIQWNWSKDGCLIHYVERGR